MSKSRPQMYALVGPTCAGKTTYAAELTSMDKGIRYLATDGFSSITLAIRLISYLYSGRSIVLDGMFTERAPIQRLGAICAVLGYEFVVVLFHTPLNVCLQRNRNRTDPELDIVIIDQWHRINAEFSIELRGQVPHEERV